MIKIKSLEGLVQAVGPNTHEIFKLLYCFDTS